MSSLVAAPHRSQLHFGLIKEGVNLLHLVATSQEPKRELLAVGLLRCQKRMPFLMNVSRTSSRKASTSVVS
jgi:hypothetical protein